MKHIENYFKNKQSFKSLNNIDLKKFEPYIGPRPFDRNDKDEKRFFGRDDETDEIVSLIYANKLTLIYAQSGAGKTSILNAKISPRLEEDYGFQVLPSARIGNISTSENYPSSKIAINSSNIKNTYMFNVIQSLLKKDVDPQSLLDKQQLTDFLKYYYPPTIVDQEPGEEKNQVLIFDQLEELFTFYPNDKWREQQKDFFQQVTKALKNNIFLRIVFVIREDYLAQLDPYKDFLPQGLRPHFRLEQLRRHSALLAIKGPLNYVPTTFFQNYKGDIDKDLKNIINDLMKITIEYSLDKFKEVENEFIDPIELQVVFKQWWETITNSNQTNNIQNKSNKQRINNSLEQFYEDVINKVIQQTHISETKIRTWCEEKLITSYETRSIINRSQEFKGIDTNVIDILENECFLQDVLNRKTWYELSHDRLIKAIKLSNTKYSITKRNKFKFMWLTLLKYLKTP
jgi:hypothetical protein